MEEEDAEKHMFIKFVKPREKKQSPRKEGGVLATAGDWEMKVDLGQRLRFPADIAVTHQRRTSCCGQGPPSRLR